MKEDFGSDFMTIVDEDGTEFEIEILCTVDYNGATYHAAILAGEEYESLDILSNHVAILKSVEEDEGDPILCAIEDEAELEAVNELIMDQLYADQDTSDD